MLKTSAQSRINRRSPEDLGGVRHMPCWPWRTPPVSPDPDAFVGKSILLASEGREIPKPAIELAARLAKQNGAEVHVVSIARIWGTSLGFPHPGLMPNKREWQEQRDRVAGTVAALKDRGISASGQVLGTRNASKRILAEARQHHADAIVMAADPPRHWLVSDMIWSQEPYRVRRLAPTPVYLVVEKQRSH